MIKLGRISYVNMAPVFYRVDAEVEEVLGVPTELNRLLIEGELDTAPISSIEYARNADKLRLLPRLCVASEGAVESIQLVSRKPLEQVRVVAVTPESATSVVLTRRPVHVPRAGARRRRARRHPGAAVRADHRRGGRMNAILEKAFEGERITDDEAVALLRSRDLVAVGRVANEIRNRTHDPERVTF